mmetsp:Transcript_21442/g.40942  ORF Transcript_21442/g.40942 Transcript_21442/m.40942 type:complete len:209 (-) Transcript_21442:569-1195(-)
MHSASHSRAQQPLPPHRLAPLCVWAQLLRWLGDWSWKGVLRRGARWTTASCAGTSASLSRLYQGVCPRPPPCARRAYPQAPPPRPSRVHAHGCDPSPPSPPRDAPPPSNRFASAQTRFPPEASGAQRRRPRGAPADAPNPPRGPRGPARHLVAPPARRGPSNALFHETRPVPRACLVGRPPAWASVHAPTNRHARCPHRLGGTPRAHV